MFKRFWTILALGAPEYIVFLWLSSLPASTFWSLWITLYIELFLGNYCVLLWVNLPCFELSFFAQSGEFLSFSKAESICWNFISILINNAIVKQIEETSKIQKLRTNLCPSPSANSSDVVHVDSFVPSVAIFRSARNKCALTICHIYYRFGVFLPTVTWLSRFPENLSLELIHAVQSKQLTMP